MEAKCADLRVKVIDRIGDNTKNVQAACAQSKVRVLSYLFMQKIFFQGFSLNCLAHSAHVLMQDCVKVFEKQFNQAKDIELFLKNRYHPRVSYKAFMKPGDTHLIQVFGAGLTFFILFIFAVCGHQMGVGDWLSPKCGAKPDCAWGGNWWSPATRVRIQGERTGVYLPCGVVVNGQENIGGVCSKAKADFPSWKSEDNFGPGDLALSRVSNKWLRLWIRSL